MEYQPSTILPPTDGNAKFGGTQSRIIMGGVNAYNLQGACVPCVSWNNNQYGIYQSDGRYYLTLLSEPLNVGMAYAFRSDAPYAVAGTVVLTSAGDVTINPDTLEITGIEAVAATVGQGYWCKGAIELHSIGATLYIYQEATAGRDIAEIYDIVGAIAPDASAGKQKLAAAITSKGVPTTSADGLETMATKVRQIPQELNTGVSDFEQMIAPSPYIWNVYSVAQDLMKDTMPAYIPAYMAQYKQQYGANSFFVGEYYLGYATLPLTGADGFLTCDGDFYTIAGEAGTRIVTHTLPDGTVETYAAEEIIHTWHDGESGRCNRWVAFFYLSNAYSFTNITSSICPRRVALCGTCNSFIVSGENRLTDVWVIGTLGHFEGGTTGDTWNPAQVIRNYREHSGGAIYSNTTLLSLILPDLETCTSSPFSLSNSQSDNSGSVAQYVFLPKLKVLDSCLILSSTARTDSLLYCSMPLLEQITRPVLTMYYRGSNIYNNVEAVDLRGVRTINITHPNITTDVGRAILQCYGTSFSKLKKIDLSSLTEITLGSIIAGLPAAPSSNYVNLIDIIVGEMITNLNLSYWVAASVLADANKKTQLIDNIKNHILARVSDATGGTQLVFTVSTNMYNAIAAEQIEWQGETMSLADAFLTKNWLLAGA